ncbi:MAG: hypothetical protein K0B09_07890 [Bacteroidales bacterium]|nr:hypothetical protein [Bacteroidales bacterium]
MKNLFLTILFSGLLIPAYSQISLDVSGGLAGGPGRAFDLYLGGKIPINDHLKIKAAYRIVEGGADVSSVYNFNMLHFANLGLIITL